MTANSREPNLATALLWLFLAACAVLLLLGGIDFLTHLGDGDSAPPAPAATQTVTVPAIPSEIPSQAPAITEDNEMPTPEVCTEAHARKAIPRDRWTPCGQLLGYFDDW